MKLNLGCGTDIREGWVNLDQYPDPGVDVVADISESLPFASDRFEEILAAHVLEHIFDWPEVILECHRVLKPDGKLSIRVPYGIGKHNYTANHIRFFWPKTMDMFVNTDSPALDELRCGGRFTIEKCMVLHRLWFSKQIERYLGISFFEKCIYRLPLGIKQVIVWELRKVMT